MKDRFSFSRATRRDLLRAGMYGVCVSAGANLSVPVFGQAAAALAAQGRADGKILVVLELSGGNDGLNTLVPYGDDAYYKHRPNLGVRKKELRVIDDHFGFSGGMAGFERLYKDGKLAIVHGCGYENPSFSHFTSMAYWHTAAPNSGEEYGWVGRLADAMAPQAPSNYIVNIGTRQSLAVRSHRHVPVVFDDPNKFSQEQFYEERPVLASLPDAGKVDNPSRRFLLDTARSAKDASALVREACAKYHSPIDYGIVGLDLPKVVALIAAGMPTRLYYTSYRNNAFDTHVFQSDTHKRLLTYAADALQVANERVDGVGRVGEQALVGVALEDVRVERVIPVRGVVEARRHAGGDQGDHLGQVEADNAVVDGGMIFGTGFAHQSRGIFGAPGGVEQETARRVIDLACVRQGREDRALFVELFLRELVGIVEDHGNMAVAAHGKRLPSPDVHDVIGRGLRGHGIGQATDPAVLLAAVGGGGVPVGHGREVREGRILVTAAVHDGELAIFVEAFEARHAAAEAEVVVDGAQLLTRHAEIRAVLVIGVVAVRDQSIEAVIAARELEHHQNFAIGASLRGQGGGGLGERLNGNRGAGGDADAAHTGAQQVAAAGPGEGETVLHRHLTPIDTQAGS